MKLTSESLKSDPTVFHTDDEAIFDPTQDYCAVCHCSKDGIYIVDKDGYTIRLNRAFEKITGLCAKDLIGKHMSDLVDQGYFDRSVALEVIKRKKTVSIIQKTSNGKVTLVTGTPVFSSINVFRGVISNIRDITQLINLFDELSQSRSISKRYLHLDNSLLDTIKTNDIIAESFHMKHIIQMILKIKNIDSPVLLLGDTGVGKGLFARIIHNNSNRKRFPFVHINCGAIPEALLESELFGYKAGAFTGASKSGKEGLLEKANKGTIFLDEIGELPLRLQPKILQTLESGMIAKVGSTDTTYVDVRIIAATNRDLSQMITDGQFREDLLYRINVISIIMPPLCKRREDIIPLAKYFLKQFNYKYNMNKKLSPQVKAIILNYPWPGNIRELNNLIERMVIFSATDEIELSDLPAELLNYHDKSNANLNVHMENRAVTFPTNLHNELKGYELTLIKEALKISGSIRKAACLLQVNPSTISRKLNKK